MKFQLGNWVRDRVSGLEGVATHVAEGISGGIQYAIQPVAGKDKSVPEMVMIDEVQLEAVKSKKGVDATKPPPFEYNLGDEARDTITNYQGKIVARAIYLNGCVRYGVQPPVNEKTYEVPKEKWFYQKELKMVKAAKRIEEPKSTKKYGGPGMKIPRSHER